jgi:hypothetical protein
MKQTMSDEPATYEIRLQARPPGWLREEFGSLKVGQAPAQTALFRQVESTHELDVLLSRLNSLGLTLAEVHEQQPPPGMDDQSDSGKQPSGYEVRVDGRLSKAFLNFLRWRHCPVPEQTSVEVHAAPRDVLQLVARCSDLGLGVERVTRVSEP